jgi:uncharacterized alpha-E superfamily protein
MHKNNISHHKRLGNKRHKTNFQHMKIQETNGINTGLDEWLHYLEAQVERLSQVIIKEIWF